MTDAVLTLQEVADELGVHYMTAYRYVRLGVMDAAKSGGVWQVQRSALDRFREQAAEASTVTGPSGKGGARNRKAPWAARLESRLVAGDAPGSWSVIEAAMAAGAELDEIYLDVLTPAMVRIGERWAAGELDISVEHRATGIAMRIVGRIGPRFTRRGRHAGWWRSAHPPASSTRSRWRCWATCCGFVGGKCRTSVSTCRASRSPT